MTASSKTQQVCRGFCSFPSRLTLHPPHLAVLPEADHWGLTELGFLAFQFLAGMAHAKQAQEKETGGSKREQSPTLGRDCQQCCSSKTTAPIGWPSPGLTDTSSRKPLVSLITSCLRMQTAPCFPSPFWSPSALTEPFY